MGKKKAKTETAKFKVAGNHTVLPPPKFKAVAPGRTGECDDLDWVVRAERAGHIRRTDNRSTVFPSDNKTADEPDKKPVEPDEKGGE